MISNKYVDEYINLWKQGKIILNKERIDLFNYLQKHIYSRDDVYFDEQKSRIVSNLLKNGIFQHYHFKGLS
ncbi:Phage terminase large subunit [Staphylococcus aureus]|uniref:Phage terminase large subunit n=1 Tax=Staphylococcus aureus TaxID=1280 RepID=A0A380EMP7_STAAU|nr:Phage terminase large subunit [Staphylococcus aureus]